MLKISGIIFDFFKSCITLININIMKTIILLVSAISLFGCQNDKESTELVQKSSQELNKMAMGGINIEFIFNNNKPTFGELYLITGEENVDFPAENKHFEALSPLEFSFIDGAYYGIKNNNNIGDGVALWLFPLKNGSAEYTNADLPFDSVLMEYTVLNNNPKSAKLIENVFHAFQNNLDVKIVFEGDEISDYQVIENRINELIAYSNNELKVIPGSEEALKLLWEDHPLYGNVIN